MGAKGSDGDWKWKILTGARKLQPASRHSRDCKSARIAEWIDARSEYGNVEEVKRLVYETAETLGQRSPYDPN